MPITNWIFDLDYTLYNFDDRQPFNYNKLEYNPVLIEKLKKLNGRKILFTNGTLVHTLECIKRMKLEGIFHKVCCRELCGLKPYLFSFKKMMIHAGIKKGEQCIFFEDNLENLQHSKIFGWTTVFLPQEYEYDYFRERVGDYDYVNFMCEGIIAALDYFLESE